MDNNNNVRFFDRYIAGKKGEIYDYYPRVEETGDLQRLSGIDVAINSIRNLLLTPLGHYPFDPNFGSLLYKKLFEMSDSITAEEIEYEVRDRVAQFEDRVKVERVVGKWFDGRKGYQVDVYIDRKGVKGKVSIVIPNEQSMFGLEDAITEGMT